MIRDNDDMLENAKDKLKDMLSDRLVYFKRMEYLNELIKVAEADIRSQQKTIKILETPP